MDKKINTILERKVSASSSPEKKVITPTLHSKERADFLQKAAGVIDKIETAEGAETSIETTGEIAEELKEIKKAAPAQQMPHATGAATAIAIAAKKLIIPTIEVMQKQVAVAVKKQIRVLEIEAKKRSRRNTQGFEPFVLTGIVGRIRELKEILARLTQVTFEILKGWWLKYVGIGE